MRKGAASCHCHLSRTPEVSRKTTPRESIVLPLSPLPLTPTVPYCPQPSASPYFAEDTPLATSECREPSSAFSFPASEPSKLPDPPLAPRGRRQGARLAAELQVPPPRASSGPARPSSPSRCPCSLPHRPSGPGLTSPPTPSGSAFPRCAERSGLACTFSRRLEARSLCGGPWSGGGGRQQEAARGSRRRRARRRLRPDPKPGR